MWDEIVRLWPAVAYTLIVVGSFAFIAWVASSAGKRAYEREQLQRRVNDAAYAVCRMAAGYVHVVRDWPPRSELEAERLKTLKAALAVSQALSEEIEAYNNARR